MFTKSRTPIPANKVRFLEGRHRKGGRLAEHAGRLWYVDARPAPPPTDYMPSPDELTITVRERTLVDGSPFEQSLHYRAWPADERERENLVGPKARRTPARKPIDMLARYLVGRGAPDLIIRPRSSTDGDPAAIAVVATAGIPTSSPFLLSGRRTPRGVDGLLAELERSRVAVRLTRGGRLLLLPEQTCPQDLQAAVSLAERLIVGRLTGHPVRCELGAEPCAREAETLFAPGVPGCYGPHTFSED